MPTYSYGSRNGYSFNGFQPPYKIGKSFTFPTITGRDAPNQTGSAAQPCLIYQVSIDVQGLNTSSASTQFGVWNSNGSSGYYSATTSLSSTSSTNAAKTTLSLSAPKPVFGNTTYIVGFTKRNTQTFTWDVDTTKSGSIIEDDAGSTGNFDNDGNYESGSLVFAIGYYQLPIAPTVVVASKGVGGVSVSWVAPTDNGGTAITGYRVDRSTDGTTWSNIVANTFSVATTYLDSSAVGGSTYYYRVAAHNLVSTTHGGSYSSPYSSASAAFLYTTATPNNATSTLTASVFNPNVSPIVFADDGSGLRFNQVEIVYGSEQLYNYVVGQGTATYVAEASESQTLYGKRSYSISELLNTTADGVAVATREVLWRSYLPDLRVASVGFILNDMSETDKAALLGIDLDQPVQVVFTPNGVGDPINRLGRVIGVAWAVTLDSVTVTFRLQSAENQVFTLDSEQFGILDKDILG